ASRLLWKARGGDKPALGQARTLLDSVERRRPNWPPVLLARGNAEEMRGNRRQAIENYKKAIDLGERNPRYLRQLVQLLYREQQFAEADRYMQALRQEKPLKPELERISFQMDGRSRTPDQLSDLCTDLSLRT